MLIYKIFRADEWAALVRDGETSGAPIDVADGYVHFSTAQQVQETAAKHFSGEQGLLLLACDSAAMAKDITWEPSRGGALFPHLYRKLRQSDLLWHRDLPWRDGGHVFPEDLA